VQHWCNKIAQKILAKQNFIKIAENSDRNIETSERGLKGRPLRKCVSEGSVFDKFEKGPYRDNGPFCNSHCIFIEVDLLTDVAVT
jgi:hypothetical protein